MNNDEINKLVNMALSSMDNADRAEPMPYLQTRINARLNAEKNLSTWEKITAVISRPMVAVGGLCLLVALNMLIIFSDDTSDRLKTAVQSAVTPSDDLSMNTTTLYDFENYYQP